ncbi:SDR family oxidoreductase [Blastomonas sp. AAP53]|uniref:NAD-dependent epimerase/dehydratase family protein n=1 Tax=Blastomonas sp. AAP53 TaxID=1248760 RepID=UPI0003052F61|nr:SDR family oxidoreductase [Blastomonas sp. AAP53]
MKILITGNMGYVGSELVRYLRDSLPGAQLHGYDSGWFAHALTGSARMPETLLDRQYYGDVRDIDPDILEGVHAVVHLAAVSNDPMGHSFEQATHDINQMATLRLAEMSAAAGVSNFVFASSCSIYGYAETGARSEQDATNPLTAYARSKIGAEQGLAALGSDAMAITCLRFATACGMSDRLRLDLVLNDFVASALATGEIVVLSDGTPWRPLIDVADMARAIHWAALRAPCEPSPFLVVNAGRPENNYQVRDLASAVARHVPGTSVSINTDAPPDKRSYKVDFALFERFAPEHMPQVSLDQSIARLIDGVKRTPQIDAGFRTSAFLRLRVLEHHLASKALDSDLRWRVP